MISRLFASASRSGTGGVIVWEGDSIISGVGLDPTEFIDTQTNPLIRGRFTSSNLGGGGDTLANMAASPGAVDALIAAGARYGFGSTVGNVCVIGAGTNDLQPLLLTDTPADAAAEVIASMEDFAPGRITAGFDRVVILDILPRTSGVDASDFEEARALCLTGFAAIAAASEGAIIFVDTAGLDAQLADPDDLDFYYDSLHLTGAGNAVRAPLLAAAVNAAVGLP